MLELSLLAIRGRKPFSSNQSAYRVWWSLLMPLAELKMWVPSMKTDFHPQVAYLKSYHGCLLYTRTSIHESLLNNSAS